MKKYLPIVFAILGLCCLLGLFFGVEDEPYETMPPMSFSNLHESSVVFVQRDPVENSEPPGTVMNVKHRLHAQDCPQPWPSYLESYQTDTHGTPEKLPSTDGIDFSQTTSSKFTEITISNEKPMYNLCDVLLVKIQSRDWKNQPKTYGGDFFRMKIYHEKPYSAASEDKIIDFQNGTYLALFTLRWTGDVKVEVKLVHPVELLPLMLMQLNGSLGLKMTFLGEFVSGDISESVMCRYVELPDPACNLSNPRTHGPWYCQHPKDPRLSCKDWKVLKLDKRYFLKLDEYVSPLSRYLIRKSNMLEVKNNCSITVRDEVKKNGVTPNEKSLLPFCRMNGSPTGIHTSGHFFKGRWYPDNCTVVDYDTLGGIRCLQNKKIIILGDSTSRQIYHYFSEKYEKYFEALPLPEGEAHGSDGIRSPEYNASVQFHFHGLPVYGSHVVWKTDYIEYVGDRIISGRDGCPVVYILSLWAHFVVPGRKFYVQRMKAIQRAITGFLDRCSDGKVIIKGANTREHPTTLGVAIVSSEWCITKQELELRRIFQDEKRVGFVDALDITKAQQYEDNIHPNQNIVKEFVNRALTYICES